MNWQYSFINEMFENGNTFSNIYKNTELINCKSDKIPESLFRFYPPTAQNIIDIQNKKLWLSSASDFNDPFDCLVGYNSDDYIKKVLIKYILNNKQHLVIDSNDSFTKNDLSCIYNTNTSITNHRTISRKKSFSLCLWEILNSKTDNFRSIINKIISERLFHADSIINNVKQSNIRVACFTGTEYSFDCIYNMLLWSHYANCHKGFCVEYDMRCLKEDTRYRIKYQFEDIEKFNEERLIGCIKAGLFPIVYSNKIVNITPSILNRFFKNQTNDIFEHNMMIKVLRSYITKSTKWSYEKEWRLVVDKKISDFYNNKIPFPFIKSIYIGCKASRDLIEVLTRTGEILGVDVHIMDISKKEFGLIKETINRRKTNHNFTTPFFDSRH